MGTQMRKKAGLLALALVSGMLCGCGAGGFHKADSRVEIEAADSYLAPARINGKYGYIDESGSYVIKPVYAYAQNFAGGHAAFQDGESGLWGFIDSEGKTLVKPVFKAVSAFADNGLCIVQLTDGKCGFLAADGKLKVEAKYTALGNFVKNC